MFINVFMYSINKEDGFAGDRTYKNGVDVISLESALPIHWIIDPLSACDLLSIHAPYLFRLAAPLLIDIRGEKLGGHPLITIHISRLQKWCLNKKFFRQFIPTILNKILKKKFLKSFYLRFFKNVWKLDNPTLIKSRRKSFFSKFYKKSNTHANLKNSGTNRD
jgi:hypothetical protein